MCGKTSVATVLIAHNAIPNGIGYRLWPRITIAVPVALRQLGIEQLELFDVFFCWLRFKHCHLTPIGTRGRRQFLGTAIALTPFSQNKSKFLIGDTAVKRQVFVHQLFL